MATKTVPEDYEFEEGDRFQQVYRIDIPGYVPVGEDYLAELTARSFDLQSRVNQELEGGNEVKVTDRELTKQSEDTYDYVVTYEVTSTSDDGGPTAAGIWLVVYGIIAVLGIAGIAIVLHETRLIVSEPGGSMALLGLAAVGLYGLKTWNDSKKRSADAS